MELVRSCYVCCWKRDKRPNWLWRGKIKLYIACSVCFKRSWRERERERLFLFFVTDYTRASKQPRLQCSYFLWHRNKLLLARSPIQCRTNIALRGLDQQERWFEWWGGKVFCLDSTLFFCACADCNFSQTVSCRVPLDLPCLHSSVIQVVPLWQLLSSF